MDKLISRYKTNDPYEIAEAKNIIIIHEPLGSTLGYHSTYKRIHFIHINYDLGSTWQRFVCAHELGHAIMHPKVNTPFLRANTFFSVDRIEREANTFAVELLIPDYIIHGYENTSRSIYQIAASCGIPKELANLKDLRK
ncbi:MAG: ImmA/IrrE family metallo-endopeptidase [Desulfosporosinus sp.]|nr:ImmA/IrrE family metallo-endopeptidase [Desulfosporosinus sp.]